MTQPELRSIASPDLEPPALPSDPADCAVEFVARIGPRDGAETEVFTFTVVTPAFLTRLDEPIWGRGYLITNTFDWASVVQAVARLLAECARPTWSESAGELARRLRRGSARNGQMEA